MHVPGQAHNDLQWMRRALSLQALTLLCVADRVKGRSETASEPGEMFVFSRGWVPRRPTTIQCPGTVCQRELEEHPKSHICPFLSFVWLVAPSCSVHLMDCQGFTHAICRSRT